MSSFAKSIQDQKNKDLVIQNKRMKAYIKAQILEDYDSKFPPEEAMRLVFKAMFSGEMDEIIGFKLQASETGD